MSADNFIVVRQFKDGWYYADLSASHWWTMKEVYPDSVFAQGPFLTEEDAIEAALESGFVEYGVEPDNKPENDPIMEHPSRI